MAKDKSAPRHEPKKKPTKSLKERRAEKRQKKETPGLIRESGIG